MRLFLLFGFVNVLIRQLVNIDKVFEVIVVFDLIERTLSYNRAFVHNDKGVSVVHEINCMCDKNSGLP
jgi:hypothetical protein